MNPTPTRAAVLWEGSPDPYSDTGPASGSGDPSHKKRKRPQVIREEGRAIFTRLLDLVPPLRIAREGWRVIAALGMVALWLMTARLLWRRGAAIVAPIETATWLATLYSLFAYRDPERHTQQPDAQYIFAPADGRVTALVEGAHEPNFMDGPATVLTIAQNPLDMRMQRSPIVGQVAYILARPRDLLDPPHTLVGIALDEAAAQRVLDAGTGRARFQPAPPPPAEARRVVIETRTLPHTGPLPLPLPHPATLRAHAAQHVSQQDVIGVAQPLYDAHVRLFVPQGEVEWLIRPGQHTQAGQTVVGRFRPRPMHR